jgi:hypothetical protein
VARGRGRDGACAPQHVCVSGRQAACREIGHTRLASGKPHGTCPCSRVSRLNTHLPIRMHLHTRQTSGTPGTVRAQWPFAGNGQRSDWNSPVGSDGADGRGDSAGDNSAGGQWGLTLVAVAVRVATTTHRNSCASSPTSLLLSAHSGPLSPALAPPWSSPSPATTSYRGAVNQRPGWHMGSKQRAHVIGT